MHTLSGARWTRHLLVASLIATTMGILACSKGSETKNQSVESATPGAADSSRPSASAPPRPLAEPPKLPAKIGVITPEDFAKAVKGVAWTGNVVPRKCRGAIGCRDTPGLTSTLVLHEAAAGANLQKFGADLGDAGVVISRMRNVGNHKEALFNLPKGNGDWYLVLTRTASNTVAKGQLVKLEYDSQGNPSLDPMPDTLRIQKCPDGHPENPDYVDAGFKDCTTRSAAPGATAQPLVLPNSFTRGAWFTCSLGCCTTEGVRGNRGEKGPDSTKSDSTTRDSTKRQQRPG